MKEAPHIYQFIEFLAAIAFFVPLAIVASKRSLQNQFFIWFTAYWAWAGVVNIVFAANLIKHVQTLSIIERAYNLADGVFMLYILQVTLYQEKLKRYLKGMLLFYLGLALLLTLITGLTEITETLLVGASVLLIVGCLTCIVFYNLWKAKQLNSGSPQMFTYYALLFEYGVSIITFVFNYLFPEKNNIHDSFLIFHVATIVTILIASYGLLNHSDHQPLKQKSPKQREREMEIQYL